jgi:RNA-directed DNA polymerase
MQQLLHPRRIYPNLTGFRSKLGRTLNEAKTSVKNAQTERFDFLGYSFGPHHYVKGGQRYLGASPSKKSVGRIKTKVSELLVPSNTGAWPEVRDRLNLLLQGWSAYFGYGTQAQACRAINHHVGDRVRNFLRRRRNIHSRGNRKFGDAVVFGTLGVLQLRRVSVVPPP